MRIIMIVYWLSLSPHLIAYTIVGTAVDLEQDLKNDVIRFSASGFVTLPA